MARIGIIANPTAGTDIRRVIAEADTADSRSKVRTLRRVLRGIAAIGAEAVWVMPDRLAIGERAADGLKLPFRFSVLEMPFQSGADDSREAARRMCDAGADVLVVLGGDGTHRMVAKGCGRVPLIGISTGTNNVWPAAIEGTLAGMAAALLAGGVVPSKETACATPRLEIERDGSLADIALVDVAVYDGPFRAARAVWELNRVKEVVLSGISPACLGLSAIGAALPGRDGDADAGVRILLGTGGERVLAAIAPGIVQSVPVSGYQWLGIGDRVTVEHKPCLLALDGERDVAVRRDDSVTIRLSADGPLRVDVPKTLQIAALTGRLLTNGDAT